ncbi:MAG TPA: chromosome segregation protein ScpA [Ruminiclostridium sp.]|nr:segregation/condensation protein A [Clostridiaceae bacterium]HAA24822.1 chromosome segregation protein ScpA [Ruminiclostridium sp.]
MTNTPSDHCTIKIKDFEGPFDLLFYLIEKNKIDIYDIPIVEITDQYLDYLFAMQEMDLEIASEFLVMAATLLHIKSRMLLPERKEQPEAGEDPREELILKLIEYKKIRDFADVLRNREAEWRKVHYKLPEVLPESAYEIELDVSPSLLKECYQKTFQAYCDRQNDDSQKMKRIIQHERVSLRLKIRQLLDMLKKGVRLCFSAIFNIKKTSKLEVATGFLAALEIAKAGKATIHQEVEFGEIYIEPRRIARDEGA